MHSSNTSSSPTRSFSASRLHRPASRASCAPRSTRSTVRRGSTMRLIDGIVAASMLGASMLSPASVARAQGGVLLQGVVDGEAWSTSKTSNLLTRNNGHAAALGRIQLWGAYEPFRGLVLYAQ